MNVVYCGNIAEVADEIFLFGDFILIEVILEKGKVTPEMLTFCYLRDIPFREIANKQELEKSIENILDLDFVLVCGFGIIFPASLLSKIQAFNLHPGVLPDYKGRHPTFFATLAGDPFIGVTLHEISAGIDEGNIIAIERINYRFNQTEVDVMRMLPTAVERLLPKMRAFIQKELASSENIGGTYFRPVSHEDITFNKEDKPSRILRIIRAQARYDGGLFREGSQSYRVKRARIVSIPNYANNENGVLYLENNIYGITISKEYCLEFTEIEKIG